MNILVTGGQGQLGNELKIIAKNQDKHNYIFSDIVNEDNILDICNIDSVREFVKNNNIDYIVNCAAYTNVNKAEEEDKLCYKINADGPKVLSSIANEYNIKFIHISTDYVFDGIKYIPYKETNIENPKSVYGSSKLMGEKECSVNDIIIRTSWLYSSFGNNFVKTMLKFGKEKESLNVVFDQIGTPTYARDLAIVIDIIINSEFVPGIYHYSNEGVCSWYDFAKMIFDISKYVNCEVNPVHSYEYPTPVKRPYYSVLDKQKIKNTYKIKIPYWVDSLKHCINILEHE